MAKETTITKKEQHTALHIFISRLSEAVRQAALETEDIDLAPPLPPLAVSRAGRDIDPFRTKNLRFKGQFEQLAENQQTAGSPVVAPPYFPFPNPDRISCKADSNIMFKINPLFWSQDNVDALIWLKAELKAQGLDRTHISSEIHLDLEAFVDNIDIISDYLLNFPELDGSARSEMEDALDKATDVVSRMLGRTE